MSDKIEIYTDGACSGNPGMGGWGIFMTYKTHHKKLCGTQDNTTNNRMELLAVIKALEKIKKENKPIIIYSDSEYLIKGITEWSLVWQKKNWKNVKNIDLWKKLLSLAKKYDIQWQWIKGHSENVGNKIADKLAKNAIKKKMKA